MMAEDKILLVARYVEGDMNEVENADFETRLPNDAELQENLEDYKHIHQSLKMRLANDDDDQAFRATIDKIGKPYFKDETKVVSFKKYKLWLPAVAAILVIGLFVWAPWNTDLYFNYAANGQMLVTERGAEKQTDLDIAASLFNEKKYTEAEQYLQKEYLAKPQNEMVAYYYGITLIENKKEEKARAVLTKIYDGESAFKYDAAYYTALSYLREDKKSDCKIWLNKIPEGTSRYTKAQELIGKL